MGILRFLRFFVDNMIDWVLQYWRTFAYGILVRFDSWVDSIDTYSGNFPFFEWFDLRI